ncbi:hypothetical protein M885DRAFT_136009 [Pelagophyceae sp. CCMP2097]|nr:hypothetical protein M885DRAFT_136009 [Pelagophyceae sp. CCMP2097]
MVRRGSVSSPSGPQEERRRIAEDRIGTVAGLFRRSVEGPYRVRSRPGRGPVLGPFQTRSTLQCCRSPRGNIEGPQRTVLGAASGLQMFCRGSVSGVSSRSRGQRGLGRRDRLEAVSGPRCVCKGPEGPFRASRDLRWTVEGPSKDHRGPSRDCLRTVTGQ